MHSETMFEIFNLISSILAQINTLQKNIDTDKKEYDLVIANDIQDLQSFEERLQGAYESIRQVTLTNI